MMNEEVSTQIQKNIRSFEDLRVWQSARELNILVYRLTKKFPLQELYGLTSQMRLSSVSVSSNIAEGYGRKQHKDKEHFYVMALGSLTELLSQFILSTDLTYLSSQDLVAARTQINKTKAQLLSLLTAHRS